MKYFEEMYRSMVRRICLCVSCYLYLCGVGAGGEVPVVGGGNKGFGESVMEESLGVSKYVRYFEEHMWIWGE